MLGGAGFEGVATHLQSGNVVLESGLASARLETECEGLIAEAFGLRIAVVTRTRDELAAVVERNPLADVAANPKRYQVSFLADELDAQVMASLAALATKGERLVGIGRELYAWHPEGVARSKLWAGLAGPKLGVKATARNWSTVTSLLALADSTS